MSDLRPEHFDLLNDYLEGVKNKTQTAFLLGIARDGESPLRTIIFYDNAIDAARAYNAYVDWGFAKNYLTVELYEPNGKVHSKILKRPVGGECTFLKKDYIEAEEILLGLKKDMPEETYVKLVTKFAKLFSKDNIRFDHVRFFEKTECQLPKDID